MRQIITENSPSTSNSKNRRKSEVKEISFSLLRVPFFLEPHYDESKPFIESNRDRLIKKWGGKEGWEIQKRRHDLKGRGMAVGIPHFNLDRLASNSMASHRLIQHIGKRYGLFVSEALYDRLNVYYFVEGHALNDKPLLAAVAAEDIARSLAQMNSTEIPMSEEEILDFLCSDEGRREIENALRALDRLGVHGIPKFIIEGSRIVDGAASPDVFARIFRDIVAKGRVERGPVFGEILGVGDDVISQGSYTRETLFENIANHVV
mmetsp:Transcript_4910/g.10425  ORF Transcript_4910/g.10425 Transcript_4910/m.10425 type:complete len:263 (-) Transcript_4910:1686-2474(-)